MVLEWFKYGLCMFCHKIGEKQKDNITRLK